jgi:aspartate racemase
MELPFWRQRLADRFGVDLVVPGDVERALVHRVIYDELCRGEIRDASRAAYVDVISRLAAEGAEAVILGCTEITLLIGAADSPLPAVDTTALHAAAGVEWMLAEGRD